MGLKDGGREREGKRERERERERERVSNGKYVRSIRADCAFQISN